MTAAPATAAEHLDALVRDDAQAVPRLPPERLLVAFLHASALPRPGRPIATRLLLDTMADLGINPGTTRAGVQRLARRGLLAREQRGRQAWFTATDLCREMLDGAERRLRSGTPFSGADGTWTLLSFSLPEDARHVRHLLRARLRFAGFSLLRDGLWIAPGTQDPDDLLVDLPLDGVELQLDAFAARPLPDGGTPSFLDRTWDLAALRAEHDRFLHRWEHLPPAADRPIATFTLLVADWLHLLRADPVLPEGHLPDDWPSRRSVRAFTTGAARLEPPALAALEETLTTTERSGT